MTPEFEGAPANPPPAAKAFAFGKLTAELRNNSDLFLNSDSAAWSQQISVGNNAYAQALVRAIRRVNDEFEDQLRNANTPAPPPATPTKKK